MNRRDFLKAAPGVIALTVIPMNGDAEEVPQLQLPESCRCGGEMETLSVSACEFPLEEPGIIGARLRVMRNCTKCGEVAGYRVGYVGPPSKPARPSGLPRRTV